MAGCDGSRLLLTVLVRCVTLITLIYLVGLYMVWVVWDTVVMMVGNTLILFPCICMKHLSPFPHLFKPVCGHNLGSTACAEIGSISGLLQAAFFTAKFVAPLIRSDDRPIQRQQQADEESQQEGGASKQEEEASIQWAKGLCLFLPTDIIAGSLFSLLVAAFLRIWRGEPVWDPTAGSEWGPVDGVSYRYVLAASIIGRAALRPFCWVI